MKNSKKNLLVMLCFSAVLLIGAGAANAEDIKYWNGFDFGPNLEYAEEYNYEADSGDYNSPAEAAALTFETMRDNDHIQDYSDETTYNMTLVDLADVEGEECYVYRLDWDSDTAAAAFAYAYQSGNIYMQGQMSMWVKVWPAQ